MMRRNKYVALQQKVAYISLEMSRTGRGPGGIGAPEWDKAAVRGSFEIDPAA
jgi:hypothetical protein